MSGPVGTAGTGKRQRSPVRCSAGSSPAVEEYETLEEVQYILLRFPSFDFFRNVHLCESPATSEAAHAGDGVPSMRRFRPDAVYIDPESIATGTPLVVINPGAGNEMIFRGQWDEVIGTGCPYTNRAVVHLATASSEKTDPAAVCPSPSLQGRETVAETSNTAIRSLFDHVAEGVTADAKRAQRHEDHRHAVTELIVPTAVLVMHRHK